MSVGQLGGECAAGGFVFCVGQLGVVSVQQVALCCVCGTVGLSECAAGGFVLCVCVCVCVCE